MSTTVTSLTLSSLALDTASVSTVGGTSYTVTPAYTPNTSAYPFDTWLAGNTGADAAFTQAFQREGWISGGQTASGLVDGTTKPSDVNPALTQWFVDDATWTFKSPYISVGTVSGVGGYAVVGGTFASGGSSGADAAVSAIDAAISTVNSVLSKLGSTSNRLDTQKGFAGKLSDALTTGVGNLVDADMAKESANLQSYQTKQQLGLQALSIANQAPQSILSLFR
ncbi:flagellin [Kordiimonas sp. A6E486]|nr:flagellin [Kordiimonas marina]